MIKTTNPAERSPLRVYIAGPMRNRPFFNFPAFAHAAETLRAQGYLVFSPAERDVEAGFDYTLAVDGSDEDMRRQNFSLREALGADLEWITTHADALALLPGWQSSLGAKAEVATAKALGLGLYAFVNDHLVPLDEEVPERVGGIDWNIPVPSAVSITMTNSGTYPVSGGIAPEGASDTDGKYAGVGEVRTTSVKGGQKGVKLAAYHLVPTEPLRILAEHYGRGAHKYADHQWRKGYEWSKSFSALMRHAGQFWSGEDYDTDEGPLQGSPHMAAVAWHAFALLQFMIDHRDLDDRPPASKQGGLGV